LFSAVGIPALPALARQPKAEGGEDVKTYTTPPSDPRPDERAEERAMRRNNDQIYTTDATVTSVAAVLDLVIAKNSDDLEFHLSPPLLPAAVENFTEGQALKIRYKGQLAPKVLQVEIAGI